MLDLLFKIFFAAFFINLLYELLHSVLYETCLKAPLKRYIYLILKAAVFDGIAIVALFIISYSLVPGYYLAVFLPASILFAFEWEIYALGGGRWKYSKEMPVIFGVGITPLLQLAFTGVISIYIVSHFFIQ